RHVSRRGDEFPKLRVGHLVAIDPEAVDAHGVRQALFRPMALGAHEERTAADENHPSSVIVIRRQARIGGATSKLTARRVPWRESESADYYSRPCEGDAAHQQAAQRHGAFPHFAS